MKWMAIMIWAGIGCASTPPPEPVSTRRATPVEKEPERARKVVTDTRVEILPPIRFVGQSATFDPISIPILDAIAATLAGNRDIKLVEVTAYGVDAIAQFQARVGAARAQAIVDQLVARGVSPKRLIASGAAQPPAGSAPVPSFLILERGP